MTSDIACSPNCWCKKKSRLDLRNDDKNESRKKIEWGKRNE